MKTHIRRLFIGTAILAVLCFFGVSCATVPSAVIPESVHVDALPKLESPFPRTWHYAQSDTYKRWWKEIAACEHFADAGSKPDSIRFYVVNANYFTVDGVAFYVNAAAVLEQNEVLVSLPVTRDESIIMHEMAHFYLYWAGDSTGGGNHPVKVFETCKLHVVNPR